uniref:Ovule protein n=1 Tax=Heterorhabditis bacteriophora TaxID=37862 RepID=A0A1I7WD14_HETBA
MALVKYPFHFLIFRQNYNVTSSESRTSLNYDLMFLLQLSVAELHKLKQVPKEVREINCEERETQFLSSPPENPNKDSQ